MTFRTFLAACFLGTDIKNENQAERSMLREFETDRQQLEKSIKRSELEERLALLVGRHVPNILMAASAGALAAGYTQPA